jgi:hypothetical protein
MGFKKCLNPSCDELIDTGSNARYHSNSCRQYAYRLRKKMSVQNALENSAIGYCRNCGKPFMKRTLRQEFCKVSCRSSFWQQMKRLAEKELAS